MANSAERLGRAARRSDRLKVKIEMLPTLRRNIPLTEPMNEEQIEKMEIEMANLQREMKLIEDSYGPDHLNLVLARGYLVSILSNTKVERYLNNNHGEILGEFRKISASTSIGNESI